MFYKFFDKKTKGSGVKLTNKSIPQNEQLAEELHKPIIKKFKRREVYSEFGHKPYLGCRFSRFNNGYRFLLCVIDIYSKYAWVVPLKDKRGVSIVNAFPSILNKSNRKPNKIWVDKGSEFYKRSMKVLLLLRDLSGQ